MATPGCQATKTRIIRIIVWMLASSLATSHPYGPQFHGNIQVQDTNIAPVVLSESDERRDFEVPSFVDPHPDVPCASEVQALTPEHVLCLQDVGTELPLRPSEPGLILDFHNSLRSKVNPSAADMLSLVWDTPLALLAEKAARQCNLSLNLMTPAALHSLPEFPGVYLAMNMAPGKENWEHAITSWFKEADIFEYGAGSLSNESTFDYTNMVAGTSSRVGCGAALCPNIEHGKNFVCYYASEYEDGKEAYPYELGDWCSLCMSCTDSGKLCTCNGRVCLNGGRLDIRTCTCTCFDSFRGSSCESRRPEN